MITQEQRQNAAIALMQEEYPHRSWSTLTEDAKESWFELVDTVLGILGQPVEKSDAERPRDSEIMDYIATLRRTSKANLKITEALLGVLQVMKEWTPEDPCIPGEEDECTDCVFQRKLYSAIDAGLKS